MFAKTGETIESLADLHSHKKPFYDRPLIQQINCGVSLLFVVSSMVIAAVFSSKLKKKVAEKNRMDNLLALRLEYRRILVEEDILSEPEIKEAIDRISEVYQLGTEGEADSIYLELQTRSIHSISFSGLINK